MTPGTRLRESCPPRWATARNPDRRTLGATWAKVADLLGLPFMPHQQLMADVSGELHSDGRPVYRTCGAMIGRQAGKTTFISVRIASQLLVPRSLVLYAAQDREMAREKWMEHVELLQRTPLADKIAQVYKRNGGEYLRLTNGSKYRITTPGEHAGRGLANVDLVVIDEAYRHRDDAIIGALNPTMAVNDRAQLWILSNAGDDSSGLLRTAMEQGRAATADPQASRCWFEWAADPLDDPHDQATWAKAIPSLDHPRGVKTVAVADALGTMSLDTFKREYLNIWAEGASDEVVTPAQWRACHTTTLTVGPQPVLAVDVTPRRDRASIAAATLTGGRVPVEVIDSRDGTDWLVARTVQLARDHDAVTVVVDPGGPAGRFAADLEAAGVHVTTVNARAYGHACATWYDLVVTGTLAHLAQPELDDAVTGAARRPLGDQWAWTRRHSVVDISPVVAVTLAAWAAWTQPGVPAVY